MFDKKLGYTVAGIFAVVILALSISSIPDSADTSPIQQPLNTIGIEEDAPPEPQPAPLEFEYTMREHNGFIAVFLYEETEPFMVFETRVKYLPDYDRILLEKGIPVKNQEELKDLIEDYIS